MNDVKNFNKGMIIDKFHSYFKENKSFLLLLGISFVFMCLSIIYYPLTLVTIAILIIGACFFDFSKIIIIMILYCFCFNGLVDIQVFSNGNLYTNSLLFGCLTLIITVKYLCLVCKKKIKINWLFAILCLLFFVYISLPIYEYKINILWIYCFVIGIYCIFEIRDQINFKEIVNYVSIGIIVSSLLSFVARLNPYINDVLGNFYDYNTLKFQALFLNPNFLGIYCVIILSALLLLQIQKWSYLRLIFIALIYGIGYSTISRAFLICSTICLCVYFLFLIIKNKKQGLVQILYSGFCIVLCFIALFPYTKVYYLRFDHMISKSKSDIVMFTQNYDLCDNVNIYRKEITSDEEINSEEDATIQTEYDNPSRDVLLKLYWEDYTSSPITIIFGKGVCATHDVGMSPHNSYIGLLWNVGILGALLIFCIVIYVLIKLKIKYISSIILIPFLFLGLVETLFFTKWFWLVSLLIITGDKKYVD